jgi:hypothetical protein
MVCVTGAGADVDSAWEQKKLEATHSEMLALGAARRPLRSALIRVRASPERGERAVLSGAGHRWVLLRRMRS